MAARASTVSRHAVLRFKGVGTNVRVEAEVIVCAVTASGLWDRDMSDSVDSCGCSKPCHKGIPSVKYIM